MKVHVSKKWWQFWLPSEIDINIPHGVHFEHTPVGDNPFHSFLGSTYDNPEPNESSAAIEADEAEPWYGGDAVEDEDSSVVTAEPPVVYANRGNARMEERRQARERQQ